MALRSRLDACSSTILGFDQVTVADILHIRRGVGTLGGTGQDAEQVLALFWIDSEGVRVHLGIEKRCSQRALVIGPQSHVLVIKVGEVGHPLLLDMGRHGAGKGLNLASQDCR